jgi:hypothetical protein
MTITAAIRRMLESGLTVEQALAAAEAFELETAQPVNKRQERNRRYYERKKASESVLKASEPSKTSYSDALPSPEGSSPKPLSPNPHLSIPPSPPKGGSSPALKTEFDHDFWPRYPNKVGKPDALKAFLRARNKTSLETIAHGLDAYVHKTDDRPWCNPSTWLNQERWNDQPATVSRQARAPPREPTLADYFEEEARRLQEVDDARTIETDYRHGHSDKSH